MMKILITVCFLLITTWCPWCQAQPSEVAVDPASKTAIKIFSLENADATECVNQLKELDPSAKIVADPRTNSVIVSSSNESQLRILEVLVLRLDEKPSQPSPTWTSNTGLKRDRRQPLGDLAIFEGSNLLMEVESLPEKIAEKESVAIQLAETIRKHKQTPDGDPGEIIESRKRLEAVLAEALELKFLFERMQLQAMEERISQIKSHFDRIKSHLEQRKKSMKLIVDRRATELIEGEDSRWTPKEFESAEVDPKSRESENAKQKPTAGLSDEHAIGQSQDDVATDAPNDSSLASPIPRYRELSAQLGESILEQKHAIMELMRLKATLSSDSTEMALAIRRVESARLKRKWIQDEYAATLKDLEVQVASAKSSVQLIERKKARLEKLNEKELVSQSEVDEVRDQFKQAQFGLERLQIRLGLLQEAGESAQADLEGSNTVAIRTDPLVQPKAVEEESSDANPNNFVSDGFPGDVASKKSPVPETYEQCAEVLRTSTNVGQLRAAIAAITKLRNSNSVPTVQENASVASSFLIVMAHEKTQLAPELHQVFTLWDELDTHVKFAAILKSLRGQDDLEKVVAVKYSVRLTDFVDETEFSSLCEELLKLGASPNIELRNAALRVVAGTLPITKLNSLDFKSTERQEMVSRLKTVVPSQKVVELMKNAIGEQEIAPAFMIANLVGEHSASIDDENLIARAIEILFQIAHGQFAKSTPSKSQRGAALRGLTRFQSRPKLIVPKLMELMKSDKTDLVITGQVNFDALGNSFCREAIIGALATFGKEAKDALPLLEDELTLVKIKGQGGNAKRFLELAIQKIEKGWGHQ